MRRVNPDALPRAGRPFAARSSAPKPSARRRARPRWLGPTLRWGTLALALGLVGSSTYLLWHSGWLPARVGRATDLALAASADAGLRVTDVLVEGRSRASKAEILAALGAKRGMAILSLDPAAAKARLEAVGWVREATVERRLPDTIYIRIDEREPFAFWQQDSHLVLIDRTGVVIAKDRLDRFGTLPVLVGPDAPQHAAELTAILAREPSLRSHVTAAIRVGGRRWNIRLDNRIDVRLPEDDPAAAWSRLAAIEREKSLLARDLVLIDLRIPDRLVVRLAPDSSLPQSETGKST